MILTRRSRLASLMRSDRLCGGVDESPCGGRLDETASALKLGQFMSIQGMRRATTRLDSATHSLCARNVSSRLASLMRSDRLCGGVDESPCGGRLDETASEAMPQPIGRLLHYGGPFLTPLSCRDDVKKVN
jgi:hypothetical protein